MATYTGIEDAIIAALQGVDVRNVASYGGEFSPDSFGRVPLQLPAILVHVAGMQNDPQGDVDLRSYQVVVYVAARDLRGEQGSRRGAYAICDATRQALNRADVMGVGTLEINTETLVGYSQSAGICVMQIRATLPLDEPVPVY